MSKQMEFLDDIEWKEAAILASKNLDELEKLIDKNGLRRVLKAETGSFKVRSSGVKLSARIATSTNNSVESRPNQVPRRDESGNNLVGIANILLLFKFVFPKKQRETILEPIVEDLKADYLEALANTDSWWQTSFVRLCLAFQVVVHFVRIIGVAFLGFLLAAWKVIAG